MPVPHFWLVRYTFADAPDTCDTALYRSQGPLPHHPSIPATVPCVVGADDRVAATPPNTPPSTATTAAADVRYRHRVRLRRAAARSSTAPTSSGGASSLSG